MPKKVFLTIIAFIYLVLLLTAVRSKIYLGDECYHYRLAKVTFSSGRQVQDPVYNGLPKLGYVYSDFGLWHMLLAGVWKAIRFPSPAAAQVYQLAYLFLLTVMSYLLAVRMYGRDAARFNAVLLLTAPMIIVFSIVLYIDVPLAALTALCVFLIVKNRLIPAGIVLGLMIFTKVNALLLIPGLLLMVYFLNLRKTVSSLKKVSMLLMPAFAINLPDMYYRFINFGYIYYTPPKFIPAGITGYISPGSIIHQPLNIVFYFGVGVILCLILYFIFRSYESRDLPLWILIISYALLWGVFFRHTLDIRYLSAIFPFLVILSSKTIISLGGRKLLKYAIYFICAAQFISVITYIYLKRQIPQEMAQGYEFVNARLPVNAVIMYPGEDMVTYTGRPIAWGRVMSIADLFWGNNERDMRAVLEDYGINYIVIRNEKIYDDRLRRDIEGYPRSFVNKLPQTGFLNNIFENNLLSIWKVAGK